MMMIPEEDTNDLDDELLQSRCNLCNLNLNENDKSYFLFEKSAYDGKNIQYPIATILSSILSHDINNDDGKYAKVLCTVCYSSLKEYEKLEKRLIELKEEIIQKYNETSKYYDDNKIDVIFDEEKSEEGKSIILVKGNCKTYIYKLVENEDQLIITTESEVEENDNMVEVINNGGGAFVVEDEEDYLDESNCAKVSLNIESHKFIDLNNLERIDQNRKEYKISKETDNTDYVGNLKDNNEDCYEALLINDCTEDFEQPNETLVEDSGSKCGQLVISKNGSILVKFNFENFYCLLCTKLQRSFNSQEMSDHLKEIHRICLYFCDRCGQAFVERNLLEKHFKENNCEIVKINKPKYVCDDVGEEVFTPVSNLQNHMNQKHLDNSNKELNKCIICDLNFNSKYTLKSHLKIHAKERTRNYKCDQCGKSFFTQANLKAHIKTHAGLKEFECDVCQKAFSTFHNMEMHKNVHTGDRPFQCEVCERAFLRRCELKDHERTHTGEKPFVCDLCQMAFAQMSNLHSHKRATHFNVKNYKCDLCNKSFKRRRQLDYHLSVHKNQRPIKCKLCPADFIYPEHYKKHLKTHSGTKSFVCEVCGKAFFSLSNKNTHRLIHNDRKPYECFTCNLGFTRKQSLLKHMQKEKHLNSSIIVNQYVKSETTNGITTKQTIMDVNLLGSAVITEENGSGNEEIIFNEIIFDEIGDNGELPGNRYDTL